MDYDEITYRDGHLLLRGIRHFDLQNTLDSGQCFRWSPLDDSCWEGVACGRRMKLRLREGGLTLYDTSPQEFESFWRDYFDLGRDYGELRTKFIRNPALRRALEFAPGIRVLRQEPFEALCSFILSQNNNVPRIRGLVQRLCECFGERGDGIAAFPKPEALAALSVEELAPVRSGFRAKYLLDAARRVASGGLVLEELYTLELAEAKERLMQIYGVGSKVADCVLLYGFGRIECIPMDVWMKRVMEKYYPSGMPKYLRPWGGIAQQTLFHYARTAPGLF